MPVMNSLHWVRKHELLCISGSRQWSVETAWCGHVQHLLTCLFSPRMQACFAIIIPSSSKNVYPYIFPLNCFQPINYCQNEGY